MKDFIEGIKRGVQFSGRASRKNFWMFYLFSLIIGCLLAFVGEFVSHFYPKISGYPEKIFIYCIIVPLWAISWRRLHDVGKPGTYTFVGLIPGGIFVLFYLWSKQGQLGENKWGKDPSPSLYRKQSA